MLVRREFDTFDRESTWDGVIDLDKLREAQKILKQLRRTMYQMFGNEKENGDYDRDKFRVAYITAGVELYLGNLSAGREINDT